MASAFPEDDLMVCGFCDKTMINPKMLPCQHSCCENCLKENIVPPIFRLSCPICEKGITIYKGDVRQLPDDSLFHIIQKQRAALAVDEKKCIPCHSYHKRTTATHKCLDCPDTFCSECKKFHIHPALTKNHTVVEMKDIQDGKYNEEINRKQILPCPRHSNRKTMNMNFYCEDCQCLVCHGCITSFSHQYHTYSTVDAFDTKARSALRDSIQSLEKRQKREVRFSNCLNDKELTLKKENEENENKIHKACFDLHDLVDKFKENKLEKVKMQYENEIEKIRSARNEKQRNNKQTNAMKSYAEAFLQQCSKVDFVNNYKDLQSRVQGCIDREEYYTLRGQNLTLGYKPCVEAKVIINAILGEITTTDKYFCVISMLRRTSHPMVLFDVEAEKSSLSGLAVTCQNDVIAVGGSNIDVFSNHGVKKPEICCWGLKKAYDVTLKNDLIYITDTWRHQREILITNMRGIVKWRIRLPECQQIYGRYPLGLAVDDEDNVFIASSATNTVYRCYPNSLTPVRFLSSTSNPGIQYPQYLCVTPKPELVVSNCGSHNIQGYSMDAELLWQYDGRYVRNLDLRLHHPFGVCCDKEGLVYVCDYDHNRIQIVKESVLIRSIQLEGLQNPKAVVLNHKNELIIAMPKRIMKIKIWK